MSRHTSGNRQLHSTSGCLRKYCCTSKYWWEISPWKQDPVQRWIILLFLTQNCISVWMYPVFNTKPHFWMNLSCFNTKLCISGWIYPVLTQNCISGYAHLSNDVIDYVWRWNVWARDLPENLKCAVPKKQTHAHVRFVQTRHGCVTYVCQKKRQWTPREHYKTM